MAEQIAANKDATTGPIMHSKVLSQYTRPGSQYSHADIIRAATSYLVHGSIQKVATEIGIPRRTISGWKNSDWWVQLSAEISHGKEPEFLAAFKENARLALRCVKDRLENGDTKLVKGKEGDYVERKVPVGARDAMIIAGISYDKLRLERGDPTALIIHQSESSEALRQIAKEEIQNSKMKNVVSEQ